MDIPSKFTHFDCTQCRQKGFSPLLLIAGVTLLLFLIITSMAPFRHKLMSTLFPKPASQAATNVPRYGVFETFANYSTSGVSDPWIDITAKATFTTPSNKQIVVDGFYFASNQFGLRFNPVEIGNYSYTFTISGPNNSNPVTTTGSFTSIPSSSKGFIRRMPSNPGRLMFEDGSVFFGFGFNDCWYPMNGQLTQMIGDPSYEPAGESGRFPIAESFAKYASGGFNLFRYNNGNCTPFNAWDQIGININAQELVWTDQLFSTAKANGFHSMFAFFLPGGGFLNAPNSPQEDADFRRFLRYIVARWGAYVDIWDWVNETPDPATYTGGYAIPDSWFVYARGVLLEIDPYDRLMTNSHPRSRDNQFLDLQSPHNYDAELDDYDLMLFYGPTEKSPGMPIIAGEKGPGSTLPNMDSRLRMNQWTAFFGGQGIIWWNTGGNRNCNCINAYLGGTERAQTKILSNYTTGLAADFTKGKPVSSNSSVTSYSLTTPAHVGVYAFRNTLGQTSNVTTSFTVNVPFSGTGQWISPTTGAVLQTFAVNTGSQNFTTPGFTEDIALKITNAVVPSPTPTPSFTPVPSPSPTPIPSPTPAPTPTPPAIAVPTVNVSAFCANQTSGVTISWTAPGILFNQISNDPTFPPTWFNKDLTATPTQSTTAPNGFTQRQTNPPVPLTFTQGQTYYVRIWDGINTSANTSFTIPVCSSPSPSATPAPTPKPGDVDGNNKVDIFDYNILLTDFGKTGTFAADIDKSGKVDIFDYNLLLTNFGL